MTKVNKQVIFGEVWIGIDDVMKIAQDKTMVKLNDTPKFKNKINLGVKLLEDTLKRDGIIYGVTTGVGDSCDRPIAHDLIHEFPKQLIKTHGCGLGRYFSHPQSRAIMAVRLCSLVKGFSGVTFSLLQQIVKLLNQDIAPLIPEEGSVGASGDLTPLSYLAAVLMGERKVYYKGKIRQAKAVFKDLNIPLITLKPKETLAIMNGTAVMTAIACEAFTRTQYLSQLAARLTAIAVIALKGNNYHYDENLFAVKPHAGQIRVASWIRSDLKAESAPSNSGRLQDRYSLRCAPQIIGVIQDSLSWFQQMIENELNSANDNPIIDGEKKLILHGGHFYGGHIATVMDTMKTQVANLADLLDRQMALLVDPKFNNGLPNNLSFASEERVSINHGFKAVQIAVSSWTAEALKNTMPASVFSRSTECHNQDKVSMGTIAARDCLRVLELTEQVFAAHMLALTQAIYIRIHHHELKQNAISKPIITMMKDIQKYFEPVIDDRPLEATLRQFVKFIQQQRWKLYESSDINIVHRDFCGN